MYVWYYQCSEEFGLIKPGGVYSDKIISFLSHLNLAGPLPNGVDVLNPYKGPGVFEYCKTFYNKYYQDDKQRTLILGINPGRFGGGLTGIPFTDPVKLKEECGIANDLPQKKELSADFIYHLIHAYGGCDAFYQKFYFSSVCPLGFTSKGKNYNYYDTPALQKAVYPFIVQSLEQQIDFGLNTKFVYCLGEGKNLKFLHKLNDEKKYFQHIIPLSHPRYIMQYKRKSIHAFIDDYLKKLKHPLSFIS